MFKHLWNLSAVIAGVVAVSPIFVPNLSMAQSGTPAKTAPAAAAASAGDKVDVTDLEKKYWASKDTDFSVVQNRLYTKANRFALSLQYGTLINDAWSDGPTMSGSLAYFFSERFGIEGHIQSTKSTDKDATTRLIAQSGTPNRNKIMGYQGLSANWVPFYAKMSVLNSSIIYFDMAISPGIGMTSYEQQRSNASNVSKSAPTLSLDITQSFFFTKYSAFRVDYKNRWFQEETLRATTGAVDGTTTSQTSMLLFGFQFFY